MTEQQIPTSEVLNRAADLIEERGWVGIDNPTDDSWGGGAGSSKPLCLEGGILAALGVKVERGTDWLARLTECRAYVAVKSYLTESGALRERLPVYRWNDRPGRTATEVVEVLRAVAVIEAAREQQPAEVSS